MVIWRWHRALQLCSRLAISPIIARHPSNLFRRTLCTRSLSVSRCSLSVSRHTYSPALWRWFSGSQLDSRSQGPEFESQSNPRPKKSQKGSKKPPKGWQKGSKKPLKIAERDQKALASRRKGPKSPGKSQKEGTTFPHWRRTSSSPLNLHFRRDVL